MGERSPTVDRLRLIIDKIPLTPEIQNDILFLTEWSKTV